MASGTAFMDSAIDTKKLLLDDEYDRTIAEIMKLYDPDRIALLFIAQTGCRLGEVSRVTANDITFGKGRVSMVRIRTLKRTGHPVRQVHLDNNEAAVKLLKLWAQRIPPDRPLFSTSKRMLQWHLERILNKIKPDRETLVHIFRHTKASRLVRSGAPLTYVRQQLGWSSLEPLRVYAHTTEEEVVKIMDKV
jgi:integrase